MENPERSEYPGGTAFNPARCKFHHAEYRLSGFKQYQGNHLIEALPNFIDWSNLDIFSRLRQCPGGKPEATASRRIKDHWLDSLVSSNFFFPLSRHIQLQELIDIAICQGYSINFPASPEDRRRAYAHYLEQSQKAESQLPLPEDLTAEELIRNKGVGSMLSISVTGCSGMGKTTSVNRILNLYEQVILHEDWRGRRDTLQVVYLKAECPHNGSVKGMCCEIIKALDEAVGEHYYDLLANRITAEALKQRTAKLLRLYHVGILVIDEIQNLMLSNKERSQLFNFIVGLSNTIGVPLLFVGTPKIRSFMQSDFRAARRFGTLGSLKWYPLKRGTSEWSDFLKEAWLNFSVLKDNPVELPQEVQDKLYDCSQGIIDILLRLLILSQKAVMIRARRNSEQPEAMTAADIDRAFEDGFDDVKPMINALRTGDINAISCYEDLAIDEERWSDTVESYSSQIDSGTEAAAAKSQEEQTAAMAMRITEAQNGVKPSPAAQQWAERFAADHPELPAAALAMIIQQYLNENGPQAQQAEPAEEQAEKKPKHRNVPTAQPSEAEELTK